MKHSYRARGVSSEGNANGVSGQILFGAGLVVLSVAIPLSGFVFGKSPRSKVDWSKVSLVTAFGLGCVLNGFGVLAKSAYAAMKLKGVSMTFKDHRIHRRYS